MSNGISNLGPISTPELNTSFFVGSVLYATIQSAVTAAAAITGGAQVVIPYGATPSDTIGNASGSATISIVDNRNVIPAPYTWSGTAYVPVLPSSLQTTGVVNAGTGFQVAGVALASTNLSDTAQLARLNSNITGTAANVTGVVTVANGGTGQTTASSALAALGGLPLTGGTLTGPLVLPSGTPTGQQAVSANYLATQFSSMPGVPSATAAGQFPVSTGSGTTYTARALTSSDIPNNAANTTGTAANVTGVVALANGGTGATTASSALAALGGLSATGGAISGTFTGSPTFSGTVTYSGTANYTGATPITFNGSAIVGLAVVPSSATPVFNGAGGTVFPYTMAQAVTSSTTNNLIPGMLYTFEIIQAASGSGPFPFAWPANMSNTSPISQVAGQKSVQLAVCLSGGTLLCVGAITYI